MKALVIGGNRFFGKRLVENLVKDSHDVTVLNRGSQPLISGTKHISCDRTDSQQLKNKTQGLSYDVIFDQVCMTADDSLAINEILISKTPRYIMVSSQSVYGPQANLKETDYNPYQHPFTTHAKPQEDYAEAKRQAEAVLMQHKSSCLVSTVRLPFVLGLDDYTGRLKFHIKKIFKQEPIYFPNINALFSVIHAQDAAACIQKLGMSKVHGPINFASSEPVKLLDLVHKIETLTGHKAIFAKDGDDKNWSPYGVEASWYMNVEKAQSEGIACHPTWSWLDPLLYSIFQGIK
jgi:nucleoside-diphosphate-sugar epimerase